jgi:hypothetical protein
MLNRSLDDAVVLQDPTLTYRLLREMGLVRWDEEFTVGTTIF